MRRWIFALLTVFWFSVPGFAALLQQSFSGTYTASSPGGTVTLKLAQQKGGSITGGLTMQGETLRLTGTATGGEMTGRTITDAPEDRAEIHMHFESGKLILEVMAPGGGGSQSMTFTRQGAAPVAPKGSGVQKSRSAAKPKAVGSSGSAVIINGERVSEEFLTAVREQFNVIIPAGKYWYDRESGAWGVPGGPTAGVTLPGVAVGGPLRADASNGHSGTFINGRELPAADIRAFAQIGIRAQKGRFTCDAQSNIRREGEYTILFNVAERMNAVAAARRPKSYLRHTSSGYLGGDGQTSYFFDPQTGSSVMIGG